MQASTNASLSGPGRPRKFPAATQPPCKQDPTPDGAFLQGLLRLERILAGDPVNGVEPLVPVSRSTWYAAIREGRFPPPVTLPGVRGSFWRAEDVHDLLKSAA
jgi:predicted DNA-binding transcriptional regulator AlpA